MLLKDESQHQDSRRNKATADTFQILHGNLNIVFPTDIKQQDNLMLKVVVRACYGAYFVAHIFKYLAPNFASGRPAWCCFVEFLYNSMWNI